MAYLRYYPAVLLLWAYGIGLTIARRWRDLHHLLSHPVHTVHGGPHRFVYVVSEWLLEGYRNEIWERLPDLQGRTPDSDHRYGVLDGWRNSFAAVMPDFEDLHDTWEILFALIYCEHAPAETDRQSMHFWAPIGRNVSRWASRDRILARITDGDLHDDLVSCHASYDASARPTGSVARRVPAGNGRLHCQGAQRGHGPRGARPSGDRHARHCRVVALANMPDIPCGPRLALTRMANSEAPELA